MNRQKVVRYAKEAGIDPASLRYIGEGMGRKVFFCIYEKKPHAFKIEKTLSNDFTLVAGRSQFKTEFNSDPSPILNLPIQVDWNDYKWGIFPLASKISNTNFKKWCGISGIIHFINLLKVLIISGIIYDISYDDMESKDKVLDILVHHHLWCLHHHKTTGDTYPTVLRGIKWINLNLLEEINVNPILYNWLHEFIWYQAYLLDDISFDIIKPSSLGFIETDKGPELKIVDWGV